MFGFVISYIFEVGRVHCGAWGLATCANAVSVLEVMK